MKKGLAIGGALLIGIGIWLYLNKTAKKGGGKTGGGTSGGNTGGGTSGGNTSGGTSGGNTSGGNTGTTNTGGGTTHQGGGTGSGTTHQGGGGVREVIVKLPQGDITQKLTRLRKSCERKGGTWVEERDSSGLVVIGGTCINLPVPASVLNQQSTQAHVGNLNITYQSPSHGGIRNNTSSNTGSSQDTSGSSVGEVGGGAGGGSAPSGGGASSGGDGCFVKGTLVTLFDGEKIKIENIKEGAEVLTYHKERGNEKGVVIKLLKPKSNNIIQIDFEDGTKIQCTKEHPIYIKGKGWSSVTPLRSIIKHGVKSKKLKVGDIALKEISETKITNISNVVTEEQELYNLMINGNRNYYANGVLVHNKGTGNVGSVPTTSSSEYGVTDEEIGTIIDSYLDQYA